MPQEGDGATEAQLKTTLMRLVKLEAPPDEIDEARRAYREAVAARKRAEIDEYLEAAHVDA